jgi:hypothetical protein
VPPMVNWLRRHWVTSADPWTTGAGYSVRPVTAVIKTKHAGLNPVVLGSVGLVSTIGPLVFIFSKGLERASAQAFFRLYKRVGPEDTSRQAKIF